VKPGRTERTIIFTLVGLLGIEFLALESGLRINSTASYPLGIYWALPKKPEKGDLVMVRPPCSAIFDQAKARGYIGAGFGPGEYQFLIKRMVATAGDDVTIDSSGVYVDGRLLENSRPQTVDGAGRPMQQCSLTRYHLSGSEILLMSDYNPQSFDSRYFGPIDGQQIQSVVVPVLTWR
jgi:conjugative transfer signal peptidase TraF